MRANLKQAHTLSSVSESLQRGLGEPPGMRQMQKPSCSNGSSIVRKQRICQHTQNVDGRCTEDLHPEERDFDILSERLHPQEKLVGD